MKSGSQLGLSTSTRPQGSSAFGIKSLLASSVLCAFAGSAAAQSSVTIYGVVDGGITRQNGGTSTLVGGIVGGGPAASGGLASASARRWDERAGWASRIGFRGLEDLGGGYQAAFNLEHRFTPDTGAYPGNDPFWAGISNVKLISPFGEVSLGRDYQPAFWIALAADPFEYAYVGQLGRIHTYANFVGPDFASSGNSTANSARNNNTVAYKTPMMFGGLTAQAMLSLGEGARGVLGRSVGGNVQYQTSKIYLGAGFEQIQNNGAGNDPQLILVTGTYDFGFVKPIIGYARNRTALAGNTTDLSLGARVPIGASGIGKIVAARLNPAGSNNNLTKFGLGYEHRLSKRTSLYTDIGTAKNQAFTRTTAVDLGITTRF